MMGCCFVSECTLTCVQVCNSLGQCHCDFGYAPPDCSQPGSGGSNHSNPAFNDTQMMMTTDRPTSVTQAPTDKQVATTEGNLTQAPADTSGAF